MRTVRPEDSPSIAQIVIDAQMFPEDARGFIDTMMESYFATGSAEGHACLVDELGAGSLGSPVTSRKLRPTACGI